MWYTSYEANSELRYFQVVRQTDFHRTMVVLRLLLIHNSLSWGYIADHLVPSQCIVLKDFPHRVSSEFVNNLIETISVSNIYAMEIMKRDLLPWLMLGRGSFYQQMEKQLHY